MLGGRLNTSGKVGHMCFPNDPSRILCPRYLSRTANHVYNLKKYRFAANAVSETCQNALQVFSPAKINVFLRIVRRRDDGFHDLASLFHVIDLGDDMDVSVLPEGATKDELSCNWSDVPLDESNLVIKAARLFREKTGRNDHFRIHLEKKVPHGAGMGGGSGNAATMLWAANSLCGEPASNQDLLDWSGDIGSDISVFFSQGAAYCTGRGEIVENVDPPIPLDTPLLLVKPPVGLSTPQIFKALDLDRRSTVDPKDILDDLCKVWSTELGQIQYPVSAIFGNVPGTQSKPIEFVKSDDDDAWAKLEAMRWDRADSWDDSKALMMKRLKLLRKMISSSDQLRQLWSQEIERLQPMGIVMSAGGKEQLTNAYASMVVLRNVTQSTLPVAVCHFGDEISEESKAFIRAKISNVEFIDLATFPFPSYHLPVFDGHGAPRSREEGYQVKLLALRAAPFKEVVYIDVDSFPLEKPESLFKLPKYVESGNIFWPDLWRGRSHLYDFFNIENKSPWHPKGDLGPWRDRVGKYFDQDKDKWDIDGIDSEPLPPHQTEAGQLVLNREKHWDVLEYLLFINMHYNMTYNVEATLGDKDTFRVAFALAGKSKDFYQVEIGPSAAMIDFEKHGIYGENPRYKTLGNIQLHPSGHMVFHHKTIEKIPAQGDPGYRVWPIDLVTAPLSDMQSGNMLLGGSEWQSLGKGWLNWGFIDYDLKYFICGFNCSCNLRSVHKIEKLCTGRSEGQKEIFDFAFPVTGVKLSEGHLAQKASAILADAVNSLPEGGI